MWRVAVVAALLFATAQDVKLPDPRTGSINGESSWMYWPVRMQNGQPVPLPPDGCEIHMVPIASRNEELVFRCGEWLQPPVGKYDTWLEQRDSMTPFPAKLIYGERRSDRGMLALAELDPAGHVAIPDGRSIAEGQSYRLIHLDEGTAFTRTFERRIAFSGSSSVLFPTGSSLAALFNNKTDDAIAVGRPFKVSAGRTTVQWPEPPTSGTDIVAILPRPRFTLKTRPDGVEVVLKVDGAVRRPDVFSNSADKVVAVWYGVEGKNAELSVRSSTLFISSKSLVLRRGVVTVRDELRLLPNANVSIQLKGNGALPDKSTIQITKADDAVVREAAAQATPVRFESLQPEEYDVLLRIEQSTLRKTLDLTSGNDADVTFEVEPIDVHGTVYYGSDPAPATIRFLMPSGEAARASADDHGQFEARLWQPRYYTIQLDLERARGQPFTEFAVPLLESRRLDFRVPRNEYSVRVLDAQEHEPVREATVFAGNKWLDASGQESTIGHRTVTGADGIALLQPLRPGTLMLRATAKGYLDSDPVEYQVTENDGQRSIELRLSPIEEEISLKIELPEGSPAANAEAWATQDPTISLPVWRGAADDNGVMKIPRKFARAVVVIRHQSAAPSAVTLRDLPTAITLPKKATAPLSLNVETIAREHANHAMVACFIDGVWIGGPALAFATGSAQTTDAAGRWDGLNLPAQPLRVLAWRASPQFRIEAYEALATTLPFPWPAATVLQTVN